jgi:ABC-type multidrug transport system fused ATPase/permease subunit
MLNSFLKLFLILNQRQKRDFFILQSMMLSTAIAELIGIASILPFISVASSPELIQSNQYLAKLYNFFGAPPGKDFLLFIGCGFIMFVILANSLLVMSQYFMNRYSHRLGGEFADKLYNFYLHQPITFHAKKNSADMIQHIMRDANKISASFIAPALRLNARAFSIVLLSSMLFFINYIVALSSLAILGVIYWFIFYFLRQQIYKNGQNISEHNARRNRILNESFEGIKEVKLFSIEEALLKQFKILTSNVSRSKANNMILGQSPYYIVETVVLVGVILITLFFTRSEDSFESALPLLTLYCIAVFKLVPKIQQSYLAITKIKGAEAAFKATYQILKLASEFNVKLEHTSSTLTPKQEIRLKDIWYKYPGANNNTLEGLELLILAGETVAITGESGNGKSTLLDILMGLNLPDQGSLIIDNKTINDNELSRWRNSIGYVPQFIYLSDTTIAQNIAFGKEANEISEERVQKATQLAGLTDFITSLPAGIHTNTGERGGQLSGGQKQRIGIARALYREISVLVLDEATSALDNDMQQKIMNNLKTERKNLTVIMVSHREETLKFADKIYKLKDGLLYE